MSGLFSTLNVANKGMQASQTALHTTGHNISNANTEGYSRQRVELKASLAFTLGGVGQLGTGVKMDSIIRSVDDYVTKQIRQENGTLQQNASKSEVLEQLEIIFNEPSDTGLNFNLGEMFDSWQELSKNPEMLTSKTIVVEKSKTMAETLNHIAKQLNSLEDDTVGQMEQNVKGFNSIVGQLDALNKQIFNISIKGQVPNDLLDQRDVLLKDLSSITDFEAKIVGHDMVEISIKDTEGNDVNILNAKEKKEITLDTINPKSGKLAGFKEALAVIAEQKSSLDKFASTMANKINELHSAGHSKEPFFSDFDSASTIKVNDNIAKDNSKVNAGTGDNPPEGDGTGAQKIAEIRNAKLDFSGNDNIGDNTIEGAYNSMVTKVGIFKEQSDNMVENQEVLLDQLVLRRESTSGVSIDEEVSNLIKFQKSFEANARVIQVLSEMLDVLINRTGV